MIEFLKTIYSDLSRYKYTYKLRKDSKNFFFICLESFLFKPGFQAVLLYRISNYLYKLGLNKAAWFVARLNQFFTSAEIEYNTEIGSGFFIAHPSGIVIGRGSKIGKNFMIYQNSTLGTKSLGDIKFPIIKDNVTIFAGAKILGGIVLEDNVTVGANAVVTKSISKNKLVIKNNKIKKQ